MKLLCAVVAAAALLGAVAPSSGSNDLEELDAKIVKHLKDEKWDDASKAFVMAIWADYKMAHLSTIAEPPERMVLGKLSDAESCDEYLGDLIGPQDGAGTKGPLSLTVEKDEHGRFFVELDRRSLPAVTGARTLVFTTGDVVRSSVPWLGQKPYCQLEMFMITRKEGKYYMGTPDTPRWIELTKVKEQD